MMQDMTVAIDLMPYKKGGMNGGVVPAAIATMQAMVNHHIRVIAITTDDNNDELAFLENYQISRANLNEYQRHEENATNDSKFVSASGKTSTKTIIYARIKHFFGGVAPQGLYDFCVRHRDFFRGILRVVAHPYIYAIKPVLKWLIPHRMMENRMNKPKGNNAIIQSIPQVSLERLTGEKVDIFFCPFTGVSVLDPTVPILSQVNDIQHHYLPFNFTSDECQARELFYQRLVRTGCYFTAISDYTRKCFIETYQISEERIRTIYLSIQDRFIKINAELQQKVLSEEGLKDGGYLYYPANFWKHKNHRSLLIGYQMFLKQHPDSHLNLVFTGWESELANEIRDAVRSMNLTKRIHFMGYVKDEIVYALMNHCGYLIYPSLFEGFGIPLLEAMQARKPILCSSVTSIPEVVGTCAIYFEPYNPVNICNAITTAVYNKEKVNELIKGYDAQLARFTKENYISSMIEYMKEICNSLV